MWNKLESIFGQKTETSLLMLNEKFFMIKTDTDEDMATYVERVEKLVELMDR